MEPRNINCYGLLLVSLLLVACSDISGMGDDNAPSPAPLVKFQPSFKPNKLWSAHTNSGTFDSIAKLSIAVTADKIFTADPSGRIVATAANTGNSVWEKKVKAPVLSGPVVGAGMVVVGTANGRVIALAQNDGAIVWQTDVTNQVLAAPQIADGRVLVKTINGKLSALDARDGHILWVYDHGAPLMMLRGASSPQLINGIVIAGFSDGKIAGFNTKNGNLLWERAIAMPAGALEVERIVDIDADPVVADNRIYIATYQGNLASLLPRNGDIVWQHEISTNNDLAVTNGLLIVTDAQSDIHAFYCQNGRIAWQQTQLEARNLTAPAAFKNTLVVGDAQGYLHWLARDDGHLVARILVDKSGISATPVVLGDTIYVLANNGRLFAYR